MKLNFVRIFGICSGIISKFYGRSRSIGYDYSAYFKVYIEFIMGTGNVQFVIDQDYRILFDNCDNI